MDSEQAQELIKRYEDGQCTPEEIILLEGWFNSLAEKGGWDWKDHDQAAFGEKMKRVIDTRIEQPRVKRITPVYLRVAAAVAGFAMLSGLFYLWKVNRAAAPAVVAVNKPVQNNENRVINLPDGSRIVLHSGSSLLYDKSFKARIRQVTLTGEAYFDIKHDASRPFIIYSGKVHTTVLGTAFNIKAYAEQKSVTVTVTRGKVKVEDETKLIAVLTPDQQVVYNWEKAAPSKKQLQVKAQEALTWAGTDMTFDALSYKELAERLDRRYNTHIEFKNPALEQCPITGRFTGTETLTQVMEILSATSNTTYQVRNNQVWVDGKGCN